MYSLVCVVFLWRGEVKGARWLW